MQFFTDKTFISLCDRVALNDPDLQLVIRQYGYPPLWTRAATFETLIHIILEQQVSLASALAALKKLKEKIIDITPQNLSRLSDEELKACYFSRQKISYAKHLAHEILNGHLNLAELNNLDSKSVKEKLIKLKGIGNWSADIYLMMVMHRCDVFPLGDIALLTSVKELKSLPKNISKETISMIVVEWKPYQTIAAYILWHSYLCKRKRQG